MTPEAEEITAPLEPRGEDETRAGPDDVPSSGPIGSLLEGVEDLVADAKLYFEAEINYQKSRASFVSGQFGKAVALALAGLFLAFLATIGLTVGLVIALTPLITAWGATAVVVLGYLLLAYLLVRRASAAWGAMMAAIREDGADDGEDAIEDADHGQ